MSDPSGSPLEEVARYHDNSKYSASGTNTCGMPLILVPDPSRSFGYRFLQVNRDASYVACLKCGHVLKPDEFVDEYTDEEEEERTRLKLLFASSVEERVAQEQETRETVIARLQTLYESMEGGDEWYGTDFYQPMRLVGESLAILKLLKTHKGEPHA